MKIGLLGADSTSENLGVQALAFSQICVIETICQELSIDRSYVILSFGQGAQSASRFRSALSIDSSVEIKTADISFRNQARRRKMAEALASCDLVFGITGGDSFSDIYGMRRFVSNMACFYILSSKKVPYVLAPQTYGPFSNWITKSIASGVFRNATKVFSRDESSGKLALDLGADNVQVVTDVAFFLPYEKRQNAAGEAKVKVGINVSGLLWNGGYSGANEFGLKTDYPQFIKLLLKELSSNKNIDTELISHVVTADYDSVENDYAICVQLAKEFKNVTAVEPFDDPIEAKGYISGFDCFLGSRMHATIASFSSGVPTLPIAYSKKFEGLFGSLGYKETLDLRFAETSESVSHAVEFVYDCGDTRMEQASALKRVQGLKEEYLAAIRNLLSR